MVTVDIETLDHVLGRVRAKVRQWSDSGSYWDRRVLNVGDEGCEHVAVVRHEHGLRLWTWVAVSPTGKIHQGHAQTRQDAQQAADACLAEHGWRLQ